MAIPVWMDNLIAYSLQMAILAAAGTLLVYLFRLRVPRVCFLYWQILLLVCLILPGTQSWKHAVQLQTAATANALVYDIPTQIAVVPARPSFSITPEIIGLAIGAGACLRLLWLVFGYLRLRNVLRRSQFLSAKPPAGGSLSSRIGARVRFFLSNEIDSPATFGVRNPVVIMPGSFDGLSEACREAVVCTAPLY
jgi:hypothetical protein